MPWICRIEANGGLSGLDDFSEIEDPLSVDEIKNLAGLLKKYRASILEENQGKLRIDYSGDCRSLGEELQKVGFKWLNNDPNNHLEAQTPSQKHWKHYSKLWDHIKAPLKPGKEDLGFVQKSLDILGSRSLRGLLLGVTSEISRKSWSNLKLICTDNEISMIKRASPNLAVCADWFKLPFPERSFDIALGDGSLNAIEYANYPKVVKELSRVLVDQGIFSARVYVQPAEKETPEEVFSDVLNIKNFHAFKWRLAMALQKDSGVGVCLADIWQRYKKLIKDHSWLSEITGWPIEEISTIDAYRQNLTIYSFPRAEEVVSTFSECFEFLGKEVADYELAERCPTLRFRKL